MIETVLHYAALTALYALVAIEAVYFVLMPILIIGIVLYHGWERIREEVQNRRYRKQARKLLGSMRSWPDAEFGRELSLLDVLRYERF